MGYDLTWLHELHIGDQVHRVYTLVICHTEMVKPILTIVKLDMLFLATMKSSKNFSCSKWGHFDTYAYLPLYQSSFWWLIFAFPWYTEP